MRRPSRRVRGPSLPGAARIDLSGRAMHGENQAAVAKAQSRRRVDFSWREGRTGPYWAAGRRYMWPELVHVKEWPRGRTGKAERPPSRNGRNALQSPVAQTSGPVFLAGGPQGITGADDLRAGCGSPKAPPVAPVLLVAPCREISCACRSSLEKKILEIFCQAGGPGREDVVAVAALLCFQALRRDPTLTSVHSDFFTLRPWFSYGCALYNMSSIAFFAKEGWEAHLSRLQLCCLL